MNLNRALELRKAKDAEEVILQILRTQGKCKGGKDSKFDPVQLKMGTKVEKEHTVSSEVAKEIAKDHLVEDAEYYTKLDIFESVPKKKGLQRKILEWFREHQDPRDEEQVHKLADSMGMEHSKLEEEIYKL